METAGITDPAKLARHLKTLDESFISHQSQFQNVIDRNASHKNEVQKSSTPLKCYRCKMYGHIRSQCSRTHNNATTGALVSHYTNKHQQHKHVNFAGINTMETFMKKVQSISVTCFEDFGSECSFINNALLNKMQLEPKSLSKPINIKTLSR